MALDVPGSCRSRTPLPSRENEGSLELPAFRDVFPGILFLPRPDDRSRSPRLPNSGAPIVISAGVIFQLPRSLCLLASAARHLIST